MPNDDTYTTIYTTYDPFQADIIGDLLRENGIPARVLGTRSGAMIGVGQVILQQYVSVPRAQAGQAADFIEDFLSQDGADLLREAGVDMGEAAGEEADGAAVTADGSDPASAAVPGQRSHVVTAGMALLTTLFAGGHFYAQRHWTGAFLLAGQLIALSIPLTAGGDSDAFGVCLVMFGSIRVFDLIASQFAVRAHNRGVRAPLWRQWVIGGLAVAASGALGQALGPHLPLPQSQQSQSGQPAHQISPLAVSPGV